MNSIAQIAQKLKEQDDFILCGHENPDPDSLGSMLGLFYALCALGKNVTMVKTDPLPEHLTWSGLEHIAFPCDLPKDASFATAVVLDCATDRTGLEDLVERSPVCINLDHHEGNLGSGHFNYVNPKEAATALIIYKVIGFLGIPVTKEMAVPLYGGILSDTGGFRHANTDVEVLETAAVLASQGAHPNQIYKEIYDTQEPNYLRLLGHTLEGLTLSEDGKVAWMQVTYEDFARFGVNPRLGDGMVQYARMVKGCEVAILFRETAPSEFRLGFRSNTLDVESLARSFQGGGHRLASGAKMQGTLEEVKARVLPRAFAFAKEGRV